MNYLTFEKLLQAPWTWRQPITKKPASFGTPISDLFIWRSSRDWQTSFELIDIPGLFANSAEYSSGAVTLKMFDSSGHQLLSKELNIIPSFRQTINLSSCLNGINETVGTFAVFHKQVPVKISTMGSYLAERGYVSYQYQGAPLRSYVHGNLDAISQNINGQLQMLGCSSFFKREYRLQFMITPNSHYQLCIVNPTSRLQRCRGKLISVNGERLLHLYTFQLDPGAIHVLDLKDEVTEPGRIIIESHMVMARPLVFRIQNSKMDVFHG